MITNPLYTPVRPISLTPSDDIKRGVLRVALKHREVPAQRARARLLLLDLRFRRDTGKRLYTGTSRIT